MLDPIADRKEMDVLWSALRRASRVELNGTCPEHGPSYRIYMSTGDPGGGVIVSVGLTEDGRVEYVGEG